MKQSPEMQNIQDNMKPGNATAHGYLGDDNRNLVDIMAEDYYEVTRLGLNHELIAERLAYFTDIAAKQMGNPVIVDEHFEVVVEDHRGIMLCPFTDNYRVDKRNTKLTNLKLNKTVYWSDLNIHMIGKHGFYEGIGSFFRVDPYEISIILELIK